MTVKERRRGWLGDGFHHRFREILLHSLARHGATCPVYCLMPDHVHLLLLGSESRCDQRALMRFLRKYLASALEDAGDFHWQKQAYDHVLRDRERGRESFSQVARYIAENPVRAGFVETADAWKWTGGMIPGYPALGFFGDDYWETFWKIYYRERGNP